MRVFEPVKISCKNIWAAKFRSFLTVLGIVIGVSSVIVIMAIGQSVQLLILDQISGIGSNLIAVIPGASEEDGPPAAAMGIMTTTLKYDDLEALLKKNNVPEISSGTGYVVGTETVSYKGLNLVASFTGTTSEYIEVENAEMEKGRFLTKSEEVSLSRVIVLGSALARDLFYEEDPIGKSVKLKDQNYEVIGILKERGASGFGTSNQDNSVLIPLKTAQKLILGIEHLGYIRLKVKEGNLIESAMANVKSTLRERHNIKNPIDDDFSVRNQASAMEMVENVTNILRYFLLVVGSISLVVGGVGIMNVMLIAVNQRIREVGLRKAIGAKNSDVLTQFLIESISIAMIGGISGIILGILISFLISLGANVLGYSWFFIISWQSVFLAVLVSASIGMIFGLYPAIKAARISPMEALRYE